MPTPLAASELDAQVFGNHRCEYGGDDFLDKLGCRQADGVGERNALDAGVGEQVAGGDDLIDAPGVAVGIAEGH